MKAWGGWCGSSGRKWAGVVGLAALLPLSCAGKGSQEDPVLRLSADEALEKGTELMANEKYGQATQYLEHAFEVAPNSSTGRTALLMAADSLFLNGGTANYIKGEAKYRDFQNRFPTSDRGDYVQIQIAHCLAQQMRRPDRDQKPTQKALEAYEELLSLYPTSTYVEEANARIVDIRQNLAEHEFLIGRYNYRRRLHSAAISRLEGLLEEYPDYRKMDGALYFLGVSYKKSNQPEKAGETFARLRSEYPDSDYVGKIPREKDRP